MAPFPTIHISCPCNDSISIAPSKPSSSGKTPKHDDPEESDMTFDPGSARSNFSLFPLENLLYCEDCNQIRCPRCVHDEIVCYFCPNCLFEVPSSTVKTEGNRCTRNCFSCPICFASLSVTAADESSTSSSPYILLCPHCFWSSVEIGVSFEKPTSITAQLAAKLKLPSLQPSSASTSSFSTPTEPYFPLSDSGTAPAINPIGTVPLTPEEMYTRLKSHYASQRAGSGTDEFGTSPGALSRLMGLYSSTLSGSKRNFGTSLGVGKQAAKQKPDWHEYEHVQPTRDESALINKMRAVGFTGTTSSQQRIIQPHHPLFISQLRPLAALLRTKRSKRCRACRHILVKPESKVTTTRFRIKLVAMNYIPALAISRLDPASVSYSSLTPLNTHQFLLTITNPLFDPINVTLATPQRTPGRFPTEVTILCPDFEVGANTDVWDEALASAGAAGGAPAGVQGTQGKSRRTGKKTGNTGTVWDAGRNWTTVVIEIVPPLVPMEDEKLDAEGEKSITELDRIVQIPVCVRVEYETDLEREDGLSALSGREQKEKREHTYWSVLGLGRIGKFGGIKSNEGSDTVGNMDGMPARPMGRPSSYSVSKPGAGPGLGIGAFGASGMGAAAAVAAAVRGGRRA